MQCSNAEYLFGDIIKDTMRHQGVIQRLSRLNPDRQTLQRAAENLDDALKNILSATETPKDWNVI